MLHWWTNQWANRDCNVSAAKRIVTGVVNTMMLAHVSLTVILRPTVFGGPLPWLPSPFTRCPYPPG